MNGEARSGLSASVRVNSEDGETRMAGTDYSRCEFLDVRSLALSILAISAALGETSGSELRSYRKAIRHLACAGQYTQVAETP